MKSIQWFFNTCLIIIIALIAAGCEETPDTDTGGEDDKIGFFAVSDGEYIDYILLDWGLIDESQENEIKHYRIERSPHDTLSYSFLDLSTVTNYRDNSVIPGVLYFYRVQAVYNDNSVSSYTSETSGFAMNAEILPIGSTAGLYSKSISAGPAEAQWVWYKILAQGGWTYTIETYNNGAPADTHLYLYKDPIIDAPVAENDNIDGTNLYSRIEHTFLSTGKYYIKVLAYGAVSPYTVTMWYHN